MRTILAILLLGVAGYKLGDLVSHGFSFEGLVWVLIPLAVGMWLDFYPTK